MRYLKQTIYLGVFILALAGAHYAQAANVNFTVLTWVRPTVSATSTALAVKDDEIRLVTDASSRIVCQIHNGTSWQAGATSWSACRQQVFGP